MLLIYLPTIIYIANFFLPSLQLRANLNSYLETKWNGLMSLFDNDEKLVFVVGMLNFDFRTNVL